MRRRKGAGQGIAAPERRRWPSTTSSSARPRILPFEPSTHGKKHTAPPSLFPPAARVTARPVPPPSPAVRVLDRGNMATLLNRPPVQDMPPPGGYPKVRDFPRMIVVCFGSGRFVPTAVQQPPTRGKGLSSHVLFVCVCLSCLRPQRVCVLSSCWSFVVCLSVLLSRAHRAYWDRAVTWLLGVCDSERRSTPAPRLRRAVRVVVSRAFSRQGCVAT